MSYNPFLKNTSILIGVFFCALSFCSLISSCEEKRSTPTWKQEEIAAPSPPTQPSLVKSPPHQDYEAVRFMSYNIKNYLSMKRGSRDEVSPKPQEEIEALTQIIIDAQPDILGVCEIGNKHDLTDLQQRLLSRGLDLPHSRITRGADPVRSLAILSRFPILENSTATAVKPKKPKKLYYDIDGFRLQMSRGILDTTIQLPGRDVRFLGAHLKSKRPSRTADQNLMRRQESVLLRKHADDILTENPHTQLIVYGDFNDTKRSLPINILRGRYQSQLSLSTIELKDSQGETWTHYWSYEDIYSRFDYVMVSPAATRHIDRKQSSVLDPDHWKKASDHRPLLVIIK